MSEATDAGLCGASNGAGSCVYLPHTTGPHSWTTDPQQAIRAARNLIAEFALSDPTLWPILSEIDLTLSRGQEKSKRPPISHANESES